MTPQNLSASLDTCVSKAMLFMYSAIEHNSKSIWLDKFSEENLPMFSAYFDASGGAETKAVTVAGFVSSVAKWEKFRPAWDKILTDWGVSRFRMTDFVNWRGDYKTFTKDSEQRRLFIEQLVDCVRKHTNKAFSLTVIAKGWNLANAQYQLRETRGNPYCIGSLGCIELVFKWALKSNPQRLPIQFFFEDGDEGKGELLKHAKAMYGVIPIFQDKSLTPFQPADLIAWKRRVAMSSRSVIPVDVDPQGALDAYEKSVRSLEPLSRLPAKFILHESKTLLEHCHHNSIPKRM